MNNDFLHYKKTDSEGFITSAKIKSNKLELITEAVFPTFATDYRYLTPDGKVAITCRNSHGIPCLVYDISNSFIVTARPQPVPNVPMRRAYISDDGLILVCCAGSNTAYARRWNGTAWVNCTLDSSTLLNYLLRMSQDGNTIICPVYENTPTPRYVMRSWERIGDTWTLSTEFIVLPDYLFSSPYSYISNTYISGDGTLVIIRQASPNVLYIIKRANGAWVRIYPIDAPPATSEILLTYVGNSFIAGSSSNFTTYELEGSSCEVNLLYSSAMSGLDLSCSISSNGNLLSAVDGIYQRTQKGWRKVCMLPSPPNFISKIADTGLCIGYNGTTVAAMLYKAQLTGERSCRKIYLLKERVIPSASRYAYFPFEGVNGSMELRDQITEHQWNITNSNGRYTITTEDSYRGSSCLRADALTSNDRIVFSALNDSHWYTRKMCIEFFVKHVGQAEYYFHYPHIIGGINWGFWLRPTSVWFDIVGVDADSLRITVKKESQGWHRVTVVCDGTFAYLYINGFLGGYKRLPIKYFAYYLETMEIRKITGDGVMYLDDLRITLNDQVYIPLARIPLEEPLTQVGFSAIPYTI